MDDKHKGYRGGLYGGPEDADEFTPHISEPTRETTSETFHDPLFDEADPDKKEQAGGKLALASMIFGAVSLLTSACGYAALIPGGLAIVLGIIAKVNLRESYDKTQKNFALAGIVLGIMGLCITGLCMARGWVIGGGRRSYTDYLHDQQARRTN